MLKKELLVHLRRRHPLRRSRRYTTAGQPRGQIIDAVSISERPASVEDRAVPGRTRYVRRLPGGLMESLTWDRGLEMAHHKRFTVATDVAVYCCDSQSPWQHGTNENTNGLLRQYFAKGTDLSTITQAQLNAIARRLNTRPRKTLEFMTPAEKLAEAVATIG